MWFRCRVVGWRHEGVWNCPNLAAARKQFPELGPYKSTARFTAAMPGEVDNELALRFETWAASAIPRDPGNPRGDRERGYTLLIYTNHPYSGGYAHHNARLG